MTQAQRSADVHQDELCPPNKRYALMDANKKVDLDNLLCPDESRILANILQNHPLRFNIAASSLVPWIYLWQFWHTLHEDGSKYTLKFLLDRKELTLTLDDFGTIIQLPQATDNNHDSFFPTLAFSDMVPFYINNLGFTMELREISISRQLIMQMLYCCVNNVHVDSAELLWEGFHYPLKNPTTILPYPRFTKLIVCHYMTAFPEISIRAHDSYHNLEDDVMIKSIFNSGKNKNVVFRVDVPTTQSQPIESTQGTHRTTSGPRTRTPVVAQGESSAQRRSKVIRLRIPPRRSTRLTLPTPVPTTDEADDLILQDTLQVSLADQKSREELKEKQNVELVIKHLASEEIEKLVEGTENVKETEVDESTLKKDDNTNDPGTRLEPRSNKESPEVEITAVVTPVNVNEKEEELTEDEYELKRREKGKHVEESRNTPFPTPIRSLRIHSTLISSDTEKLQELTENVPTPSSSTPSSSSPKLIIYVTNRLLSLFKSKTKTRHFKRYKSFFDEIQGHYGYLFAHLKKKFMPKKKFHELGGYLQEVMEESLPKMVDASVRSYMSGHILHVHPAQAAPASAQEQQYQLPSVIRLRDQDDHHDEAPLEGEKSTKRHKTSEYETYVSGESSSGQVNESETDSYASNDDEITNEQVLQDLMDEMSQTIDEAKLHKVVNEMLRQQCTSGDEHQYHIDQMQNFLKNDIVWESRKEILVSPHPKKSTSVVLSCQRDPKAPALSLVNHDLLYLKKRSSCPDKIVMSLHKFPAVRFLDDDIVERTSRWIFYIRTQKESGKPKEEIYSNSKIIQIIKTYWELGHEHKIVTEIIARRANGSIVSITESDYKNLNKNDIEDMYLLIVNNKVPDYAETGLLWSLSVFIRRIKKHKMFSIVSEPIYGIIYKNNKKEKRVMSYQEAHKFCDATLKRVLEGLKSYNNDVKYGYVKTNLSKEDVEYLQLFKEEIEERLKHHEQMRH
ncbi:hypothetical protein Tco_0858398 [Tanacetum coccineum]|uniref:Uncharacterized protein n=1 Tax=Tanacetum coccineum TaxID=301880 RepID=A0ABQ5BCU9_9ASTR